MYTDFSTLKTSNLYFPKFRVIKAKKKTKLNYFMKKNNNQCFNYNFDLTDIKSKTNYFLKNTIKIDNEKYTKIPPNTFRYKLENHPINHFLNRYDYHQLDEVNKNNISYKTLSKFKINKIYIDLLKKKNNTKLKSQGMATCDSFYNRHRSKINFRNLSLGKEENNMDNLSSFNNGAMKEFYISKKNKLSKKKIPLTKGIAKKILKDKYAYIYMSDKSELIKYWRRITYNPLNV